MIAHSLIYPAPERPLRIGVIGVGNMGQHHARILDALPTVQLVGICDIQPERGVLQAQRYGVDYFQDYRALIPYVNAVCIAVPTSLHHQIGLDCLRLHCHVLIEKPIAMSISEAQSLLSMARQSHCILQVGHIERFNPAFLALKQHLGVHPILHLAAERMSPQMDRGCDVSVVMDLMIHDLDLMILLAAAPVSMISAQGHYLESGYLAAATATLQFSNGILGTLIASKVSPGKRRWFRVQGQNFGIEANFLSREAQMYRFLQQDQIVCSDRPAEKYPAYLHTTKTYTQDPLQAELAEFVKCVCDRTPPIISGNQALAALYLAKLIENCIAKNKSEQEIQKNTLIPTPTT